MANTETFPHMVLTDINCKQAKQYIVLFNYYISSKTINI